MRATNGGNLERGQATGSQSGGEPVARNRRRGRTRDCVCVWVDDYDNLMSAGKSWILALNREHQCSANHRRDRRRCRIGNLGKGESPHKKLVGVERYNEKEEGSPILVSTQGLS